MEESSQFEIIVNSFFEIYNTSGDYVYDFYFVNSRFILDTIHHMFDSMFHVFLYLTIAVAMFYLFMALTTFMKEKKNNQKIPKNQEPFVTIQIPTYNELAALNCAKRCLNFDYPKDRYEIIIGDDSSDKSISAKIDAFAKVHEIIKVTRRGNNAGFKPGNLNHMLKFTDGEIIVIFDSDFLPESDFLKRIIAPFVHDNNLSVVQARWNLQNFSQNIFSVLGGTISLLCHNIALPFITRNNGSAFLCGSAEAIRKSHLIEVGGWLSGSLTEDIECSLRLLIKGRKLMYLENLKCDCETPYTLGDLCKQQMRWAFGVISAFKLHFSKLVASPRLSFRGKFFTFVFASGYLFAILLILLTVFGTLAVISDKPAPINWSLFLSETLINVLWTSGILLSSIIALIVSKKLKDIPKMIASSLSVGLLVTYYVNVGIAKAIFNRDMQWFMLNKNGNKVLDND